MSGEYAGWMMCSLLGHLWAPRQTDAPSATGNIFNPRKPQDRCARCGEQRERPSPRYEGLYGGRPKP